MALAEGHGGTLKQIVRCFLRSFGGDFNVYAIWTIQNHFTVFGRNVCRLVIDFVCHDRRNARNSATPNASP